MGVFLSHTNEGWYDGSVPQSPQGPGFQLPAPLLSVSLPPLHSGFKVQA